MSAYAYRFSTVKHVLEYYMENRGFHVKRWDDLARMTKVFIDIMGNRQLKDLTPEHFQAYISGRKRGAFGSAPAHSTGTTRRELTHLKSAINFCLRARLIDPNHVPFIPMPEAPAPRSRWLDKSEIEALRRSAKPFSRADTFIRIALATGARKRSIETLQWRQIDFRTGIIDFSGGRVQTNKRRSMVPMTSDLRVYLESLHTKSDGDYVMEHTGDIRKALDAVSNRAGVAGVTPHVFRHTWATHASMNGVSLTDIARILGNSVITTEKVYAKFQPGYLKTAIEQAAL